MICSVRVHLSIIALAYARRMHLPRSGVALVLALALSSACHDDRPIVAAPPIASAAPAAAVAPADEHGLPLGAKVPAFRLERLDGGGSVGLPSGRVTILAFIATWNEPAKKMLAPLQKIHAEYAAKGIDVIAIAVDDEVDLVRGFTDTHGAKFAVVWDRAHVVSSKLRPPSMPTAYVVDRGGALRFASFGYHEGDGEILARNAASLL
jgi:thiol-disulfide isomerase/thioredoxin